MRGKVLITRPIEDAQDVSFAIKRKDYDVVCAPFLAVVLHDKILTNLENYSGVIFTSRNAVRAFCKNATERNLSVWTVGNSTKELALEMGFKDVQSAGGTVKNLKDIILKANNIKPLLYVRGQDISKEIDHENIHEEILYHTDMIKKIDENIEHQISLSEFSHILFFSARTAQAFVNFANNAKISHGLKQTKALCLGDSMVSFVSVLPWKSVEVAQKPNRESLLKLLD